MIEESWCFPQHRFTTFQDPKYPRCNILLACTSLRIKNVLQSNFLSTSTPMWSTGLIRQVDEGAPYSWLIGQQSNSWPPLLAPGNYCWMIRVFGCTVWIGVWYKQNIWAAVLTMIWWTVCLLSSQCLRKFSTSINSSGGLPLHCVLQRKLSFPWIFLNLVKHKCRWWGCWWLIIWSRAMHLSSSWFSLL